MYKGMTEEDFIEDNVSFMFLDKEGRLRINKNIDDDIKYFRVIYKDMIKHEKEENNHG